MKENYDEFIMLLDHYRMSYLTLLYSNSLLYSHLIPEDENDCNKIQEFVLRCGNEKTGWKNWRLTFDAIRSKIQGYSKRMGETFDETHNRLPRPNSHFLRTKALNVTYEIISFQFPNNKPLMAELHSKNWFQVLYVLRNNASHFDNRNKPISFPKAKWLKGLYGNKISWNGVEIEEGMHGDKIIYNDLDVIFLMDKTIEFFMVNKGKYST